LNQYLHFVRYREKAIFITAKQPYKLPQNVQQKVDTQRRTAAAVKKGRNAAGGSPGIISGRHSLNEPRDSQLTDLL